MTGTNPHRIVTFLNCELVGESAQAFWCNCPSGLVRVGREGPVLTGIRRAASADLPPLAARLYQLAAHAGQPAAAERLTRLFGRTTCPDCASDFSVPDQVVAFQA
ncbi:hypothetical protein [Streptomyces sp. NPDC101149]|uniref:hypothetical protein n=1 Tax=Streptomyces sp. NPDC101149 TaxID=3366113 RepID=UPI0037FE4DC0